MKKIAAVALLHALVSSPVFAADGRSSEPNLAIPGPPPDETARLFVERLEELGKFRLLQVEGGLLLYGQIFSPRTAAWAGLPRQAGACGLHVQFDGVQGVGVHFGWDRQVVGPDSGNLYSLGATIRF